MRTGKLRGLGIVGACALLIACDPGGSEDGCGPEGACDAGAACADAACGDGGAVRCDGAACGDGGGPSLCGNGTIDPGETCDGRCPVSCDDGVACTRDSRSGRPELCTVECSHAPIEACADGDGCCAPGCGPADDDDCAAPCDGAADFDGTCPSGCTAAQDTDCAQWPWEASRPPVGRPEDYPEEDRVYVNPNCESEEGCCGEGSRACPLASLADATLEPDHAYLVKRGTTTRFEINTRLQDRSLLGAWGDPALPRPIIASKVDTRGSDAITLREVEITHGAPWGIRVETRWLTLYDVSLHGPSVSDPMGFCIQGTADGLRILHSEIYHCGAEAFYGTGDLIEVGHSTTRDTGAECLEIPDTCGGDAFQLAGRCRGYWFHDNRLDHSLNTRKFIVINTCEGERNALFERNDLIVGGNQPIFHFGADPLIVRYNRIEHVPNHEYAEATATSHAIHVWAGETYEVYGNVFLGWGGDPVLSMQEGAVVANNLFAGFGVAIQDGAAGHVLNNLFVGDGTAIRGSASMVSHNLFTGGAAPVGEAAVTGAVDAVFVDFAGGDYRLADDSPARDAGTPIDGLISPIGPGGAVLDRDGRPVPTTAVDIGPHQ